MWYDLVVVENKCHNFKCSYYVFCKKLPKVLHHYNQKKNVTLFSNIAFKNKVNYENYYENVAVNFYWNQLLYYKNVSISEHFDYLKNHMS